VPGSASPPAQPGNAVGDGSHQDPDVRSMLAVPEDRPSFLELRSSQYRHHSIHRLAIINQRSPITAASRNSSSDHRLNRLIGQVVLLSPYHAVQRGLTHIDKSTVAPNTQQRTGQEEPVPSAPKQQADAAAETWPWAHHSNTTMAALDIPTLRCDPDIHRTG
jgi:hypothetical protein